MLGFLVSAVISNSQVEWVTYRDPKANYVIDLPVGMKKKPPSRAHWGHAPGPDHFVKDSFEGAMPSFMLDGYALSENSENITCRSKNHPGFDSIDFSSGPALQSVSQPLGGRDKDWYYVVIGLVRKPMYWEFSAWSRPEELTFTTRFLKRVAVSFVPPRKGIFSIGGVPIPW